MIQTEQNQLEKNVNLSKWNRSIWDMGHAGIIIIFGSAKMSSYAT